MLCVTSTGCTSLGETCYTFCNIYHIRNHWLTGHAPEVTAIIAVLYAATTAYSRYDSFLPSWTICHLSERNQACEENVWNFSSFFFFLMTISNLLSVQFYQCCPCPCRKELLPLSISCAFLSLMSTSVSSVLERLYCLCRKVCFPELRLKVTNLQFCEHTVLWTKWIF